jgi:hypothetical protein
VSVPCSHGSSRLHDRARKGLQISKSDARTRTGDPFITSEVVNELEPVAGFDLDNVAFPDGNAVAGLLQEVFAVEMTTATVSCNACGRTEAVGALRVFRGAGIVMRCPHCDNAVVTIVEADIRVWMGFAGARMLQVNV